jgi:hypothetical protein
VVASIASGTGTLSGTTTVAAVAGIATFTNLVITATAGNFTLTFTPTSLTPVTSSSLTIIYAIGDTGPGGGKIFYYSAGGFYCGEGFTSTGSPTRGPCHYLEAAPNTWSDGSPDPTRTWATDVTSNQTTAVTGADGTAIGTGYKNSLAIAAQTGNVAATSAAVAAHGYSGGSMNDWYLPSLDELNQMCKWARGQAWNSDATLCNDTGTINTGLGAAGFVGLFYWSSSEASALDAWGQLFDHGFYDSDRKTSTPYVRPVRAF